MKKFNPPDLINRLRRQADYQASFGNEHADGTIYWEAAENMQALWDALDCVMGSGAWFDLQRSEQIIIRKAMGRELE